MNKEAYIFFSKNFRSNADIAYGVSVIIRGLKEYWPLTVRQVYYQAVSDPEMELDNSLKTYATISTIITKLRRKGVVQWHAIDDRSRSTTHAYMDTSVEGYMQDRLMSWGHSGYKRDLLQTQSVYVEVMTEKDALAGVMGDIANEYGLTFNVGKGQVSATMVNDIADRFSEADGKEKIMLYFGDLDPSGVAIPLTLERNLREYHGCCIQFIRAALEPEQVEHYGIIKSAYEIKKADPNYKAWMSNPCYRDVQPVELDALHPSELRKLLKSNIESALDMDLYLIEEEKEIEDKERIREMNEAITEFVNERYPDVFN